MSKAVGISPNQATARLVAAYAALVIEECGEDENGASSAPPLFHAALDTQNSEEACAIGRAILLRHESLAVTGCRYGRRSYPEQLMTLAERLKWSPDAGHAP
jgi:hypothetical protein